MELWVELTIQDKDGQYKHYEFFPKFNRETSIPHLYKIYGDSLVNIREIGSKLSKTVN